MKELIQLTRLGFCVTAFAAVANAQASRAWVSGVGDDVNPCSRTAPCKTFAGAISKTATNTSSRPAYRQIRTSRSSSELSGARAAGV